MSPEQSNDGNHRLCFRLIGQQPWREALHGGVRLGQPLNISNEKRVDRTTGRQQHLEEGSSGNGRQPFVALL